MAITYIASVLQAANDAIVDLVDAGAGANGTLEICTTSFGSVLISFDFAATAFGASTAAAPSVATAASLPITATASGNGTAADFRVKDADGNVIWSESGGVTATGGGGTVEITSTTISSGSSYDLTACTHTMSNPA